MAITQTYTADEVFDLNLDEPFELIDGELHILPGSGGRASMLGARIARLIGNFLEDHPIGVVLGADGSFILARNPDTILAPDAAFIRFNRLPDGQVPERYIPTHPDLAVEVISPSDRRIDAERKARRYLAAGTPLVWLVDPALETVTVYRPGGTPDHLTKSDLLSGENVLPGFETSVANIFKLPGQ